MKLLIVGQDSLAKAARAVCAPRFPMSVDPHDPDLDLVWVCYDVPLDPANPAWVLDRVRDLVRLLRPGVPVLISSQLAVGTIRQLEADFPETPFACYPENLRVATAVEDLLHQTRMVIGRRTATHDALWAIFARPFTQRLILTDIETAEMVKHAMNSYLAMSIAFTNEIVRVAQAVGADADTIATAMLTEGRISPTAPLRTRGPYGGGHLDRDLDYLHAIAERHALDLPVLEHVQMSNEAHKAFLGVLA